MKVYYCILSSIFSLFLFSCQKEKVDPISRFDKVVNIQGEKLNVDTYKFTSQGKFFLYEDEKCIIKQNERRNSLIDKVYYTQDSISSLLQHGNGPNESLNVFFMQKKGKAHFVICDFHRKKSKILDLSGKVIEESNLDACYFSVIQTNDGYIAWNSQRKVTDNKMFVQLDKDGSFIQTFGEFPKEDRFSIETADPKSRMMAYQGNLVYNPKENKMAFTTIYGIIFEIFQLGKKPFIIHKYHDAFPAYIPDSGPTHSSAIYKKDENIHGYTDVCSTDQYIYALYSGKTIKVISEQGVMDVQLTNQILVYDWNGNCVCRLVADKPLLNICVSEDDQELIALGWEDDYYLYTFDLSDVKLSTL